MNRNGIFSIKRLILNLSLDQLDGLDCTVSRDPSNALCRTQCVYTGESYMILLTVILTTHLITLEIA